MGPEGSGKGTQAKLTAEKLNVPHIVAGDILRNRQGEDSVVGEAIRKAWEAHEYLPDDAMIPIYFERLTQPDCVQGFIADGFPRSIDQASAFKSFLQEKGWHMDRAIYINISDDESIKRLLLRKRFDDTEKNIKDRLSSFHQRADRLVKFYEEKGLLSRINGEQAVEAVHTEIMAALEK